MPGGQIDNWIEGDHPRDAIRVLPRQNQRFLGPHAQPAGVDALLVHRVAVVPQSVDEIGHVGDLFRAGEGAKRLSMVVPMRRGEDHAILLRQTVVAAVILAHQPLQPAVVVFGSGPGNCVRREQEGQGLSQVMRRRIDVDLHWASIGR